ncbi:MAG: hypothetical protein LC749_04360 [Actinobacteria bacterium]|nr:hypothetical protein [Actinomycetota bacterium]
MWGGLLAVSIAGWLHHLTATPSPDGRLTGHGIRDGQAMIATLRHRLIRVPARLVRHAGALHLRLPPGHHLLERILARLHALPVRPDQAKPAPTTPEPRSPEATLGPSTCHHPGNRTKRHQQLMTVIGSPATRGFGSDQCWLERLCRCIWLPAGHVL